MDKGGQSIVGLVVTEWALQARVERLLRESDAAWIGGGRSSLIAYAHVSKHSTRLIRFPSARARPTADPSGWTAATSSCHSHLNHRGRVWWMDQTADLSKQGVSRLVRWSENNGHHLTDPPTHPHAQAGLNNSQQP